MPSQLPVPTIDELLDAAAKAVRGQHDITGDTNEGSVWELFYGPVAMILGQEVIRDRDMFRSVYFDSAEGDSLTGYVKDFYDIDRPLDTFGEGTARLSRATAGAGAGTIWEGTRLVISSVSTDPQIYTVRANIAVGAGDLTVLVPIRATITGDPGRADVSTGSILDTLWDSTFTVTKLTCAAGSTFERAEDLRARTRKLKRDRRVGYVKWMRDTLIPLGAVDAIFFASDYSGTDVGVNVCYIGDAGGNASASLVRKCQMKLESTRMLGADLMVLPMVSSIYQFVGTVNLWTDPGTIDTNGLRAAMLGRINQYLQEVYVPKRDGVTGAVVSTDPNLVQAVTVTTPSSDATLVASAWPASLTRYKFDPSAISITFASPN